MRFRLLATILLGGLLFGFISTHAADKKKKAAKIEIQRKLSELLKRRARDESDFQLRIVVHPTVLERLRTEDEKHLIEIEKRYFGKLSFRADPAMHAEQFKIVNVASNEELASVGG